MKHLFSRGTLIALSLILGTAHAELADPAAITDAQRNQSIKNEIETSISRGLGWLKSEQNADGSWSNADYPALTGLVLAAFFGAPEAKTAPSPPTCVKAGLDFLVSAVKDDGGIYAKGLSNYNTAISLTAFVLARDPGYDQIIENAQHYVSKMQASNLPNRSLNGGFGYGPDGTNREHPDLSNTVMALEALYYAGKVLPPEGQREKPTLDWDAAIGFIERTQNLPSANSESWASDDPENVGGFIYFPGHSMAGETTLDSGKVALRSYGSMSYAGLLSYVYADLEPDDPRVTAVMDWLQRHYTLSENPGMGLQGLFYYYHVMAKALTRSGVGELSLTDGTKVDWRRDLGLKLISKQDGEGFWINTEGRWMENDPVLVTSYSLLALEMIYWSMK